jgi:L-threonylcarbamoyladenylate synthase
VDYRSSKGLAMAETFSLIDQSVDSTELIERAITYLREGSLIIAPIEHAYVYVGDAFNHGAVKKIHQLRGDTRGTATQVMVAESKTIRGLTSEFSQTLENLSETFWPGLLTINIPPARGLVWDLGDERTLEEVAFRIPNEDFLREVARGSGPLAVASASLAGRPPTRKTSFFPALQSDYAALFDGGTLPEGPNSTVISIRDSGVTLLREGAISLAELRQVTPNIAVPA